MDESKFIWSVTLESEIVTLPL